MPHVAEDEGTAAAGVVCFMHIMMKLLNFSDFCLICPEFSVSTQETLNISQQPLNNYYFFFQNIKSSTHANANNYYFRVISFSMFFLPPSPLQSCQWTRRSSPSQRPCWGTARTTRLCPELCPSWPRWRRKSTSCTRTRPTQTSTSSQSYWATMCASSRPSRYDHVCWCTMLQPEPDSCNRIQILL